MQQGPGADTNCCKIIPCITAHPLAYIVGGGGGGGLGDYSPQTVFQLNMFLNESFFHTEIIK